MAVKKRLHFELNPNYCKSCGLCYGTCPRGVLKADEYGRPKVVNPDGCILCRLCELRCPDFAIRVEGI
jgi:2-oxoglutarate ferredoxin oxidoreductase subunit delta